MNEQHDWRLDMAYEPEFYSKYTWQFKEWTQTRDHWDHDHCEFCNTEISAVVNDEVLNEGWTNEDEYYWICNKCFNDFKNLFKFKVKPRITTGWWRTPEAIHLFERTILRRRRTAGALYLMV